MKKYTIVFLAVALTAVFAVTAMANEWNLYGNARMATFYVSQDYGNIPFNGTEPTDAPGTDQFGRSSFKSTEWNLQGNSRIGATVKGDMIEARFEYGTGVNLRRLYGVWKFTEGWGLKIGQDYTPITFFLSGQVFDADAGLLQVGNAYGSRRGQIAVEGMGFKFAAIQQNIGTVNFLAVDNAGNVQALNATTESYLPKLEVSYQMNFADGMSAHAFGGWQTLKYYANNPVTGADSSETVNSWVVGLGADLNFGPMYVKPQASYYRNGATAGWLGLGTANLTRNVAGAVNQDDVEDAIAVPTVINGSIGDINSLMAMVALGFSPTEALTLEYGIGYLYTDVDPNPQFDFEQNSYWEMYLQAVYQMAPGVFIIPEAGWRNFGDAEFRGNEPDVDLGDTWYLGAKWQINF